MIIVRVVVIFNLLISFVMSSWPVVVGLIEDIFNFSSFSPERQQGVNMHILAVNYDYFINTKSNTV